jgi:hypothetical protein
VGDGEVLFEEQVVRTLASGVGHQRMGACSNYSASAVNSSINAWHAGPNCFPLSSNWFVFFVLCYNECSYQAYHNDSSTNLYW